LERLRTAGNQYGHPKPADDAAHARFVGADILLVGPMRIIMGDDEQAAERLTAPLLDQYRF
jgi:hypothetical protein